MKFQAVGATRNRLLLLFFSVVEGGREEKQQI
jgi:hypothetical protein